jgi:hypothetical protein
MSDIAELFDQLGQAKRPCRYCNGTKYNKVASFPCAAADEHDTAHCNETGFELAFVKSLWRECGWCSGKGHEWKRHYEETIKISCSNCNSSCLVRREYREPIEAVGPVLEDLASSDIEVSLVFLPDQDQWICTILHHDAEGYIQHLVWSGNKSINVLLKGTYEYTLRKGWLPAPEPAS